MEKKIANLQHAAEQVRTELDQTDCKQAFQQVHNLRSSLQALRVLLEKKEAVLQVHTEKEEEAHHPASPEPRQISEDEKQRAQLCWTKGKERIIELTLAAEQAKRQVDESQQEERVKDRLQDADRELGSLNCQLDCLESSLLDLNILDSLDPLVHDLEKRKQHAQGKWLHLSGLLDTMDVRNIVKHNGTEPTESFKSKNEKGEINQWTELQKELETRIQNLEADNAQFELLCQDQV